MKPTSRLSIVGVLVLGWVPSTAEVPAQAPPAAPQKETAVEKPPTPEQVAFFEKNIRPVLVRECYACHSASAEKVRGDFKLDTRENMRKGGENGAAIIPGDPKNSPLLKALRRDDDFVQPMPPPPKKKLSDDTIADIEKWIAMGAPDPRDTPAKTVKTVIDIEKGRKYWAFQPPQKLSPPAVKDAAWPRGDIDRFLLAGMEAKGLKPVADADARTLVRRLYFDLIGLPPAPEEVEEFVTAHAARPQAAVEEVVDKLLASPRFGERWGRHWLDVARYAESSGRTANFAYPHAWRYRDYVIAAFNADKPYDQFIREQLAGDLLSAKDDKEKAEFAVATGFLAIGPKSLDERSRQQLQMDVADEQIDVTFQAFQGLTAACARCHDHKFDPIPQKDYYALSGIFRSTETCYGTIRLLQSNHPSPLLNLPKEAGVTMPLETLTAERREAINKQIADLRDQSSKITGDNAFIRRIFLQNRISTLQSQLNLYEADGTPKPLAMGVREGRLPADSRLYERGELSQPGETIKRGFPQVLTTKQPVIAQGSGRRELADWIASRDNPLTARVMANRVWLHLIGHGLVPTADNFGASGLPPSNQGLLDHLALSFADNGWSVKKLIRSIVLSRAYQMSSEFDKKNYDAEPDNVLVWHMPKRRLEAEALRDSMLALAGRLDLTPPKGSGVAQAGEGNAGFRFRAGDAAATDTRRTVYLSIVRDGVPEMLTIFDFPDPSLIIGDRPATTIPAQSLYLMNSPFVIRQADAFADRLGDGDAAAKVTRAFLLCYSRPPSEKERTSAEKFVEEYGKKKTPRAAWAALCQALFASAEFAHR
jgi:cytochrome c553